ncbi:MAG: hypothetical protein QF886_19145, partial [Planctomycetota bacterium]|nr:hypothetical protein [Planctomycetota bacterium]
DLEVHFGQLVHLVILNDLPDLGKWEVAAHINGKEKARGKFEVTKSGAPAMKVVQSNALIIDGRSSPVDLGTVVKDDAGPILEFTATNVARLRWLWATSNSRPAFH